MKPMCIDPLPIAAGLFGATELPKWIGSGQWSDPLQFWTLGLVRVEEKQGNPSILCQKFTNIVTQLQATGASLIFGMTTPPCITEERSSKLMVSLDRANRFNQEARDVMNKNGVRINDLYWSSETRERFTKKAPMMCIITRRKTSPCQCSCHGNS